MTSLVHGSVGERKSYKMFVCSAYVSMATKCRYVMIELVVLECFAIVYVYMMEKAWDRLVKLISFKMIWFLVT
jgi:hypothetical protein